RRAADEVDLPSVDVDVRLEPRQAELARGRADELCKLGDPRVHVVRILGEQRVDAAEPEERRSYLAVLGLARLEYELRAQRHGDERLELLVFGTSIGEVRDDVRRELV